MKKSLLLLTASLLGGAFAIRGEKVSVGGMPHWIADYNSIDLYGAGAPINWDAFPAGEKWGQAGQRIVPTGTAVSVVTGKIVPADGSADTFFLVSAAKEASKSDSISGYGLATAGNVYEAQLPDAAGAPAKLPEAIRAKATRFLFQ